MNNGYLVEIVYVQFWVFCSNVMKRVYGHGEQYVFGKNNMEYSILGKMLKQDESGK